MERLVEYFLLGVARMSEDALSRAMRINGPLAEWQKKVPGESSNNALRNHDVAFRTLRAIAESLRKFPTFILHLSIGPALQMLEEGGFDHYKTQAGLTSSIGPDQASLGLYYGVAVG